MSEKNTGIVTFELKSASVLSLTEEEQAQLDRLRKLEDSEIDFTDAPHSKRESNWVRPNQIFSRASAVSLEEDLLEFYQSDGAPDASRVNAVLREYMQSHTKSS